MSTIAFDIGGTWFRSAIVNDEGILSEVSQSPAISYKRYPTKSVGDLQNDLVDYLISETYRLRDTHCPKSPARVAISLGAALNAHNGLVLNSGPLWGPKCQSFDLISSLCSHAPNVKWKVVNDVTAALLYHALIRDTDIQKKLVLLTISTGIACRTYDARTHTIPLDTTHGIQGEIGHLPIIFKYKEQTINSQCDCGGKNHLNAFCSGRGIEITLKKIAEISSPNTNIASFGKELNKKSVEDYFGDFVRKVKAKDPTAIELMMTLTKPIADLFRIMFTIDPEIERVVLIGGVVRALKYHYLESLLKNIEEVGLYQITTRDPNFFRDRIHIGELNDTCGLIGATLDIPDRKCIKPAQSAVVYNSLSSPDIRGSIQEGKWTASAYKKVDFSLVQCNNLFAGFRRELAEFLRHWGQRSTCMQLSIIDSTVHDIYGDRIHSYFDHYGIKCNYVSLNLNEKRKNLDCISHCMKIFDEYGIARSCLSLIAIGGGILLDIVGLAASLYRRGINYIRIPTTLLSLIDAGIGVKVGANFNMQRNRVGSYYPAVTTFLDRSFLETLDIKEIASGLAEILKLAIISDLSLFELIEGNEINLITNRFQKSDLAAEIIRRAIDVMIRELIPNLWEKELERAVDFGHTFSPMIEMAAIPHLAHGEAVAIDIALSTILAGKRGLLNSIDVNRIIRTLKAAGLPLSHSSCTKMLIECSLAEAVKHRGGLQRVPLPSGIGSVKFINDLDVEEVVLSANLLRELDSSNQNSL